MVKIERYKYTFAIALLMLVHIAIMFLWLSNMKSEVGTNASYPIPSHKTDIKAAHSNIPRTLLANN